jgi:hypothetical protein
MKEPRFELKTFDSDIMLNHHLSQKLKLIERDKFNHLINTLTVCAFNGVYKVNIFYQKINTINST